MKIVGEADEVAKTAQTVENLLNFARGKGGANAAPLNRQQMKYAFDSIRAEKNEDLRTIFSDRVQVPLKKRSVAPMTATQKTYLDAIRTHDLFSESARGYGQDLLRHGDGRPLAHPQPRRRIILVHPAVEAGEKLGFLPGDIAAKVDPDLRPLYDALHDMLEADRVEAGWNT